MVARSSQHGDVDARPGFFGNPLRSREPSEAGHVEEGIQRVTPRDDEKWRDATSQVRARVCVNYRSQGVAITFTISDEGQMVAVLRPRHTVGVLKFQADQADATTELAHRNDC